MQRFLSFLLTSVVLLFLAIALRGVPAAEPARAATVPAEKQALPAVGPSSVKPSQARVATPAAEPSSPVTAPAPLGKGPVLPECHVQLIQAVDVPGIEAGVLITLEATEGMDVRYGMTLGHIDDREPKAQRAISQLKHNAAKAQAESDVEIIYTHAAYEQAHDEYLRNLRVIEREPRGITAVDLSRVKVAEAKAKAAWKKAEIDKRQLIYESETKEAEVAAADVSIQRRQILAPFDGRVTNVYRHPGEWVAPGDPVIKVIQLDRLRIEGLLNASEYDPAEIDGRPVTIEVELAHGRKVTFHGKVVFVSPIVLSNKEYVVYAEVTNKQENGQWVLRPGLYASMTIHLK